MRRIVFGRHSLYERNKMQYRNLVPATFSIVTITLISMSLVQVPWFVITGGVCTPFLTLGQFFSYGYFTSDLHNPDYDCINGTIVNLMRTIILFCFMAIIFSMGGLLLEILGGRTRTLKFIQRYSLASTCTVFWIMAITCICYYVTISLQESLENLQPETDTTVTYGFGFYLIAATGGVVLIGTFCTLILTQIAYRNANDERCLLNSRILEGMDGTFDSPTPPPPYSIPPPPYTP